MHIIIKTSFCAMACKKVADKKIRYLDEAGYYCFICTFPSIYESVLFSVAVHLFLLPINKLFLFLVAEKVL